MFNELPHGANRGISFVADVITTAAAASTVTLSFVDTIDIGIKIIIGVLTIILLILRIRAHLRDRPPSNLCVLVLAATALAVPVRAAPPENADPALAPWFHELTNPNRMGMSCCDQADGHILREDAWRQKSDGYEINIEGVWWPVPPDAVLNKASNPTGGAVAFYGPGKPDTDSPPKIYCFVRPYET